MKRIDYGPAGSELVKLLEGIRMSMSCETRLVMAKLLVRTVSVDGDSSQEELAFAIDADITAYFREKYPS